MALSTIPSGDVWVQIGTTQTPTSGSSVSFTSIPAVKKLRLIVQNVALTTAGSLDITINNDTSSIYNQSYLNYNGTATNTTAVNTVAIDTTRQAGASGHIQDFIIDYANQACPKLITGYGTNSGTNPTHYGIVANYNSTAVVSRVDFVTANTFNATNTGTIAIYGAY